MSRTALLAALAFSAGCATTETEETDEEDVGEAEDPIWARDRGAPMAGPGPDLACMDRCSAAAERCRNSCNKFPEGHREGCISECEAGYTQCNKDCDYGGKWGGCGFPSDGGPPWWSLL